MPTTTFTLIILMMGPTPPFMGKQVRFQVTGYKTIQECKTDESQFLGILPKEVMIFKSGCDKHGAHKF